MDFKLWDKDGQLGVYCHYAMSLLVLIFHNKNLSFIYLSKVERRYTTWCYLLLIFFEFFYLPKSSFGARRAWFSTYACSLDTLSKVYPEKQPASLSTHLETRGGEKQRWKVGGGGGRGIWVPICLSNEACLISNPTRYIINLVITHASYTYVRFYFFCSVLLVVILKAIVWGRWKAGCDGL